jgi:uncharacterized protein YbjQ (UPF0145 family)
MSMRFAIVLSSLALLAGCAETQPRSADFPTASGESPPTTAEARAPEPDEAAEERAIVNDPAVIAAAQKVRVIQNDRLGCPSEVMGLVDIHEPVQNEQQALDVLKRKAAKLGAEAVIGVEFHHGEPGEEPTHLSGMAVRCRDLLKSRSYSVLEKIEIKGAMGKEDDAEAELLARAAALHADLIVDIGFEHGEGGSEPTRVWGTAIKFQ